MELKLPEIGENISQGTVVKILVKVGDNIKKGQGILELETDKAVVEIPSNMDGVISEVLIKAGTVAKVGQPVFKLGGNSAAAATPTATTPAAAQAAPVAAAQQPAATTASPAASVLSSTPSDMTLPALGENIEKGNIAKILVKVGDHIKKGQGILEIETDKAVLEVPSPAEGKIQEILIKANTVVKVGQPIFKILAGATTAQSVPVAPVSSTTQAAAQVSTPVASAAPAAEIAVQSVGHVPISKNVSAAPSVRLFAREIGINIGQVPGSGPGGRISIDDVKKFAKALNTGRIQLASSAPAVKALPDFTKWGTSKREAMSNVRKKTAEHLSSAWNTIPHVTQFEKVDITEIEKLRKSASATTNKKLSLTAYLIKIMAIGLKKFPQFNASVDMTTNEIVFKDFVNIGVAVDTDRGLLVPVMKNVDRLTVTQISDELIAMAERARTRKTGIEELQGGTFTISNLGGIGGSFFTPIVNWPEVAILGVSRGVMEPVYVDGAFVPKLMLPLSLSYDHRLIDGADGARFIKWLASALEAPSSVEGL